MRAVPPEPVIAELGVGQWCEVQHVEAEVAADARVLIAGAKAYRGQLQFLLCHHSAILPHSAYLCQVNARQIRMYLSSPCAPWA